MSNTNTDAVVSPVPPADLRFRQVHLDFHTSPDIPGVGADFDPNEFADTLAQASVDSVTVFARCHHGHLYYPSKAHPERIHPQLARPNLLAEQIAACHARGIKAPIYVTVQWDQWTADRHRDWLCIDETGKEYGTAPLAPGFYRNLDVFHPGYRQFLFDHVRDIFEVIGAENVDGFFFDIVQAVGSLAVHWKTAMDDSGFNPEETGDRQRFAIHVIQEWEREMSAFVRLFKPDATLFYNSGHVGPRHRATRGAYTHYELESLPSGGWGYLHFPLAMRYARTLGHDCLGMTGKFHTSWGDFGSFKNPAALDFECFHMLALGAKCSIGDQLPPRGKLDDETYKLIGGVYQSVREKEPWCRNARRVADIAVLTPEAFTHRGGAFATKSERDQPAMQGAVRMLQELGRQFDIVDDTTDLSGYRLLILPDTVLVDDDLKTRLDAFTQSGGAILATHRSGLAWKSDRFVLADFPALYNGGDAPYEPDFLVPGDALREAVPALRPAAHAMYKRGLLVTPAEGAETLASVEPPYFNRTWKHFCSHLHAPSAGKAEYAGALRKGNIFYFMHPLFAQYQDNAPLWCKQLVQAAVKLLLPGAPLVETPGAPSSLLAALNYQEAESRYVLHLLHYVPERRGQKFDIVEDVILLHDVEARIRVASGETVRTVTLEPDGMSVPFAFDTETGVVSFTVPKLVGHAITAIGV